MAQVFDPSSRQWIEVPDEQVTALVGSGKAYLPKGRVPVVDARGVVGEVPAEDAPQAFANGFRYRTASEIQKEQERQQYEDRPIAAGLAGAARAVTLGGSDVLLAETGAVRPETLRGLEDYNQEASIGGELLGTAGALLASGGSATPVVLGERLAARAGGAAAARLGERAVVRRAVEGGVEGGLQGLGRLVSDAAQERDPLTAEKAMATVMGGALFGAGVGSLFGRVEDAFSGRGSRAGPAVQEAPRRASSADDGTATPLQVDPDSAGAAGRAGPAGEPPPSSAAAPPGPAAGEVPTVPSGPPPDLASLLAGTAENFAAPVKAAVEANPGVFRRMFAAIGVEFPDADEWVLRGLDVKKKGMELLREKGLLKSAPRALRRDPRFKGVATGEQAAALIRTKLEEAGGQVQAAAKRLDELVGPEDQFDIPAFAARVEQELIAPLARGTVDERRAAARLRRDLRALQEGLAPLAPAPVPRKAGVYEVPLEELDDVPALARDRGRLASVNKGLDDGKKLPPITIGQGEDGLREIGDGNHRLAAARARGQKTIRVNFESDEAASLVPNRPRGSHIDPKATAPLDTKPPAPTGRASFQSVEEWKRRLDKSLRWDSTTPNEVRDQLRQLRGLLNRTQEETAERVSRRVGASTFQEWKKAKTLYGQMAELDDIATERLADAKGANRLFSLTDNLAGVAGAVAGGGLNPAGLGLALGAALLNKWGRENLPFVMARAMADYQNNPGAKKAAQALVNRLRGMGPEGGTTPAAPVPMPPVPGAPGGASVAPDVGSGLITLLQTAAQQGPQEAWLAHTLLSGSVEYRDALEQRGLAAYAPDADAEGQRRAGAMGRADKAAADFNARADAATSGLLRGQRPAVKPPAAADALEKADAAVKNMADPEATVTATASRLAGLGDDAPGLASEMQATAQRAQAFLAQKAPRRPPSPLGDIPALRTPWRPTDVELAQWNAYLRAVEDPASALEDAAGGRLTPESVEALASVYPTLLADLRGRVVEQLVEHPSLLDYQQRVSLGLLLGMDLDESMSAPVIAALQASIQQEPERPKARASSSSAPAQKRIDSEFSPSDALTERSV